MKGLSTLAAGVFALAVASSPALATAARTFVLGTGTDTGACTLTAPCRTFAYALTQTAPSGEIIVLGSGGYGAVTITQAVSIINTSNFAGVTVASGNGITINAGTNDSVTLRGLTIDGGGLGANGIVFNSGAKLTIDQCDASNFVGNVQGGNGILLEPTSGNHSIIITNTITSNNQDTGVTYNPFSGNAVTGLVIDHVNASNNDTGMRISNFSGAISASVSNSIASGNANYGFFFTKSTVSLDASYATGNQTAGVAVSLGTFPLGRSVLMNNGIGLEIANAGANLNSYHDNRIAGNGTDVSGPIGTGTLY
jgi:hypothetical protein